VEPAVWPPAHCEALKEFVTKGMSYADAANAINARFGTAYSRNAALGRARRMGLGEPDRPKPTLGAKESPFQRAVRPRPDDSALLTLLRSRPVFLRAEGVQLRCVELTPRDLELIELEEGNCRYPYGGDEEGEAITFCGHPRREGSSYCTPHFHLARDPDVPAKRVISAAPLRLIAAAGKFQVEVVRNGTQEAPEGIRSFKRT
jgi:GcrA cell cycle regulator